ncbi:unnamed protein product, partial [Symbiodinium sp. CCMP2456]
SVSGSIDTQTLAAMTHLARSANAVPAAELRKLCYTTAQAIHDGAGPLKPGTAGAGENFHSLRETQHVPLERAASAPGGTLRRGTSYEKDFGEEPVFIDLEVNRAQANLLKSKKNYVKAPHVGTSTYSQSFRWKGGPKPPDARVPDCGVREAMSLGSPVPTTSTARSALSTGATRVFGNVEKWRPVDQLGGATDSYDFLQSSYRASFQGSLSRRPGAKRRVPNFRDSGDPARTFAAATLTSTYQHHFTRGL